MSELAEDIGILFLAGCPRTGTTALQEYLNLHPQIMVCRERYKWVDHATITRERFEPAALMDFDPATERYRTDTRRMHMQRILDAKNLTELRWVGDKFPGYLRSVGTLAQVNPNARFLITHRPIEPVVASYLARAANTDDSWLGGRDPVDLAINTWNRSVRQHADLLDTELPVLPVPYDDFHDDLARWASRLESFLGVEFSPEIVAEWRRRSERHQEAGEGPPLSDRAREAITAQADRAAEQRLDRLVASVLAG